MGFSWGLVLSHENEQILQLGSPKVVISIGIRTFHTMSVSYNLQTSGADGDTCCRVDLTVFKSLVHSELNLASKLQHVVEYQDRIARYDT